MPNDTKKGKQSTTNKGSITTTKKESKGKNVKPLENGIDKDYLCGHICLANTYPIISKSGALLKQKACTAAIWLEEEANFLVWKYKAEVGYNMVTEPPEPIMSSGGGSFYRPSRFPIGKYHSILKDYISKEHIEKGQKGLLRIPDCIILNITEEELILLRHIGVAELTKLIPQQKNIEKVVEIKFGKDVLSNAQKKAYIKIAGSADKFKLLEDKECACQGRKRDPITSPKPSPYPLTYLDNPYKRYTFIDNKIPDFTLDDTPTPAIDWLQKPRFTEITIQNEEEVTKMSVIFVAGAVLISLIDAITTTATRAVIPPTIYMDNQFGNPVYIEDNTIY